MLKITNYIYIHWLTIAMFIACYFTDSLTTTLLIYSVMILHEFAHLLSAKLLNLGVSKIVLYPFGVNLKISREVTLSLSEEIILYLSGPLVNILLALFCSVTKNFGNFYCNNLILAGINLLPILPLDGGKLAHSVLSSQIGYKKSLCVLKFVSVFLFATFVFCIFSYSVFSLNNIIFSIFLLGNLIIPQSVTNKDYVKLLALKSKYREAETPQILVCDEKLSNLEILESALPHKESLVFIKNNNGEIVNITTKTNIIKKIL